MQHIAYVPVQCYSINNPDNPKVDKKDEQIYEKIHMVDWLWITKQVLTDFSAQNAHVIPVLLGIDKTVLTKYIENMVQWPVNLTIGNLSYEIRRSQIRPRGLMVGLIFIHKKDFFEVKIKIYHQTMGIIIKCKSKMFCIK